MKWWPTEPQSGNVIRVKQGSIYHYGIYESDDKIIQFGLPPSKVKSSEDLKVLTTTIEEFSLGSIIEVMILSKKELKKYSKEETLRKANERIGSEGYNIIHNNCEHFVYECAFGYKYSEQEQNLITKWRNQPSINIYIIRTDNIDDNINVSTKERIKYLDKIKDKKIRNIKAFVWQQMLLGIEHSYMIDSKDLKFKYHKLGYWTCDKCSLSISYEDELAAIAISNQNVGISLLPLNDNNKELVRINSWNKMSKMRKFQPYLTKLEEQSTITKEILNKYILGIACDNLSNIKYFIIESGQISAYKGD